MANYGKIAYNWFINHGYTDIAAAGIVGNLYQESKVNPHVRPGDGGHAFGIAQWNNVGSPERENKFVQLFGKRISESSLSEQLQFVDWELTHTHPVKNLLNKQHDVMESTRIFMEKFERPLASTRNKSGDLVYPHKYAQELSWRSQYAKSVLDGSVDGNILGDIGTAVLSGVEKVNDLAGMPARALGEGMSQIAGSVWPKITGYGAAGIFMVFGLGLIFFAAIGD